MQVDRWFNEDFLIDAHTAKIRERREVGIDAHYGLKWQDSMIEAFITLPELIEERANRKLASLQREVTLAHSTTNHALRAASGVAG